MKQKHNSHIIFIWLGILILIFVVFFGLRYFASDYSFKEVAQEELRTDTTPEISE